MIDQDYKPFYLNNIVKVNDGYYILNGRLAYQFNEDLYYEIHIESNDSLKIINDYVDSWIYVDLISPTLLEIYNGEFVEECWSDGQISYTHYAYKQIEKTSKSEWKHKVKNLQDKFNTLLKHRLNDYIFTSNKVFGHYRSLFKKMTNDGNGLDQPGAELFGSLYRFPRPDVVIDVYLHSLVDTDKEVVLFKDWEPEYLYIEAKYNNLLKVDLDDYSLIKDHVINIYKEIFNRALSNLKFQFKDVDEQKYIVLFDGIIKMLDKTDV